MCKIINFGSENLRETLANFMYSLISDNYSHILTNLVVAVINGDNTGMPFNTMYPRNLKNVFILEI